MACKDCIPSIVVTYDSPYSSNCSGNSSSSTLDSASIIYNGSDLTCAGIDTATDLETALGKIDTKLCAVLGDYSTYNTYCLSDITTEKEFVEAISSKYCTLKSDYDTFTGTTYVADKATLNTSITTNNTPKITSTCTDYLNPDDADTVADSLQKISNAICAIYSTALDLSNVTWDNCYTVTGTPSTVAEGFSAVLTQICTLNTTVGDLDALPTFDNSSNCLSGTATDTLSDTIGAITTRICTTPTFDKSTLTWNALTEPSSSDNTDLQDSFQTVLNGIDTLYTKIPTFSSDFVTTPNSYTGVSVSLSDTAKANNKVAVDSDDTSADFLTNKLAAGDNITLDTTTNSGKVTISASAPSSSDGKVKAYSGDDTSGYLTEKLDFADNTITGSVSSDSNNQKAQLAISYSAYDLFTDLLNTLNDLPTTDNLYQLFCTVVSKCPGSCGTVTDVTVDYYPNDTTSTTTTTTTS